MSNKNKIDDIDTVTANADRQNGDDKTDGVELAQEAQDADAVALQQALDAATAKAEENWGLYLGARAEADNIQKRAERDVSNAHKYALDKFIPELLTVKDSLELGTKAAHESGDADNEQLAKFLEGSDMAITMFGDVLAKFGVSVIDPKGELFNPELHQAMTMVPNPELPNNTVMEVVQKGYTLNERLLRPAMVIVSKAD